MEVQPQLVLLQKTLLYIEGLGRQLFPQLDLWTTAKPFLEKWVQEQMGAKAVFQKVRDNLPFWNEKLPEIPDLVYDHLKTSRQLQQQHVTLLKQIKAQSHSHHQKLIYAILISAFCIFGAIVFT